MWNAIYKKGVLQIAGIPATELVKEFGSPLYVYDESVIRSRYRALDSALNYAPHRIHYAMKSNSNLKILKVLLDEGASIDAVSAEEAQIALLTGFPPEKILLTAINVTPEIMEFAVSKGILLNLGSLASLETFGTLHPGAAVSIRVNPDFGAGHHDHCVTGGRDSKFGIFYSKNDRSDLDTAMDVIRRHDLKLKGLHAHIGSGILEESKFIELMEIILGIAKDFQGLEFIDFGGGIGVPYRPGEKEFDLKSFGENAEKLMENFVDETGHRVTMAIEPGRYLSAEAGVLLTTVTDIKSNPKHIFVGVDTGFNHLIRPMAYGSYHPIVNASRETGESSKVLVAGYICESGDIFTRNEEGPEDREMVMPKIGEVLAIMNAGSYGYAMASQFNSRPRPAEVMVSEGVARLVRRRETLEDVLRTQI